MKTTIRIVELNNKSRKGTYIYIKDKNRNGSYYQYNAQQPVDYYLKYYQELELRKEKRRGLSLKKTLTTIERLREEPKSLIKKEVATQTAKKYLKSIKQKYGGKKLEQLLKKGLQATTITDAHKATPRTIAIANQKLLGGIVLDKKLLSIISGEENMKKLKNRLEHRITVYSDKGQELLTASTFGKTTTQVINESQTLFKKGEELKEGYQDTKKKRLTENGYTSVEKKNDGRINRVQIITVFRKGK